jgi:hypothetical protein
MALDKFVNKSSYINLAMSHSSSVGIETGYGLDDRGALGPTHLPIQWVSGALFLGVKGQEREVNHLPPPSAEVKKIRIYTSTPPYAFIV